MAIVQLERNKNNSLKEVDLSQRKLSILAATNPYLKESESLLLTYYAEIKENWSKSAINNLKSQYSLKLNNKLNRCFFARLAARIELNNSRFASQSQALEGIGNRQRGIVTGKEEVLNPDRRKEFPIGCFQLPFPSNVPKQALTAGSIANIVRDSYSLETIRQKTLLENNSESTNAYNESDCSKTLDSERTTDKILDRELVATQTKLRELEEQLRLQQNQLELTEAKLQQKSENLERTSSSLEEKSNKLNSLDRQVALRDRFTFLLLTHRLLPPAPPLNGTENSPAMQILGSPTTLTELRSNYKKLVANEHPDFSPYPEEEAVKRFLYVRSLYQKVYENWEKFKPTASISKKMYEKRMNAPVPWQPETFWRNIA